MGNALDKAKAKVLDAAIAWHLALYGSLKDFHTAEEQLAERLKRQPSRLRINAFLSGRFVDDLEGVRFGHAAVMVEGGRGSVRGKAAALRDAGVFVTEAFEDILAGLEP